MQNFEGVWEHGKGRPVQVPAPFGQHLLLGEMA